MTPIPSQNFSYNQGSIFGLVPAANDDDGIAETSGQPAVNLFPNPTTGVVQVSMDADMQSTECQIYDAQGRLVLARLITDSTPQLDLREIADGIYHILFLLDGRQVATKKIVKSSER